ncbi:hypothetical protein ACT048_20815 [Ectopseudomonas khazarica]|uniref:hypothetical protein n=1 Tax=Ectopseudomonas khazarica TaxID=2502979 RepID=UPI0040345244
MAEARQRRATGIAQEAQEYARLEDLDFVLEDGERVSASFFILRINPPPETKEQSKVKPANPRNKASVKFCNSTDKKNSCDQRANGEHSVAMVIFNNYTDDASKGQQACPYPT